MNAERLFRRLLCLLSLFAVLLGVVPPLWANGPARKPFPLPASALRTGPSKPGLLRPGSGAVVPFRRYPMQGDTRYLPAGVPVRRTDGVQGFGKTRVTIGGPGGATVREQVVNITQTGGVPAGRPVIDEITPFWTSDEQFIYYSAAIDTGSGTHYQIYRVRADAASDARTNTAPSGSRITSGAGADAADFLFPVLNANATRIAFIRSTNNGANYNLYVTDAPAGADAPPPIRLDPASGVFVSLTEGRTLGGAFGGKTFVDIRRPAWLGTGDIVFAGKLSGNNESYNIFQVNVTSGLIFQLTDGPADELNPAVSPNANFIAFDSNAADYALATGGTPRQEGVAGNPIQPTVLSSNRNVFVMQNSSANPQKFTNLTNTDNIQPAWSTNRTNERLNPQGSDTYIAFASSRVDQPDPTIPGQINGFAIGNTLDIYYRRALLRDPTSGAETRLVENSTNGVDPEIRKLNTVDPGYVFNDEYPAWPPFINILRLVHQSDRTGTLRADATGQPFQGNFTHTPGTHDLFVSTIIDITAPTLLRYDTSRSEGEVVHINLGGQFNPSTAASVRTPREGVLPGGELFFTVRVEDRESGMRPETQDLGAVFLVFKNPNSKYQPGSGFQEHKEFTGTAYVSPLNLNNAPMPYNVVGSNPAVVPFFNYGFEYEARAISAALGTYHYHTATIGTKDNNQPSVVYTASQEDAFAFSGIFNPPQDGNNGQPNIWLRLTRLPDSQQDNEGGILYGASWQAPDVASDWYIDVVAYDNAVNPYAPFQKYNWIIYDNVWGFSSLAFSGTENLLVVADYTLGQKFFATQIRERFDPAQTFNLLPIFFGAESYYTDVAKERIPQPGRNLHPTAADKSYNLHAPFFYGSFGPPMTLGVGSYTDSLNDDGTRVDGLPYVESQRYAIWRILSRGPVPQDVFTAYLPRPEQETPADTRGEGSAATPRRSRSVDRMIIWASPFSGDLFVGSGTIVDQNTQTALTGFVNAGGRLFISGQDIGFALTFNGGRNNTFFSTILRAQYQGDAGGGPFLVATPQPDNALNDFVDNGVAVDPWVPDPAPNLRHNYLRFAPPGAPPYDPPSNGNVPVFNPFNGTFREDASPTSGFGLGALDVVAPAAGSGSFTAFNYSSGGAGIIASLFDTNGDSIHDSRDARVAYASLGFESVGYEWYDASNLITTFGRRAEIMHNITCSFRTGAIFGRITNASQGGSALANVLVRAIRFGAGENQPAAATARTDSNGQYQIVGLQPGTYFIYGNLLGFTIQHTAGITTHGAFRARADLSLTEAPPGVLAGKVFRGDGVTPLQGIEVQLRAQNADGTISVLRGTSGADGSYNIPGVPVGLYQVIANPSNDFDGDGAEDIGPTDPRYNANYNSEFSTVVVTDPAQTDIRITPGTGPGQVNIVNGLVEIRSGETVRIDFILSGRPQPVSGRVIGLQLDGTTQVPLAGATVVATRGGVEIARTTSDEQGNYRFNAITEGIVTITASYVGYRDGSKDLTVGNAPITSPEGDIFLQLLPPGSISGLVINSGDNSTVTGATVELYQGGNLVQSGQTVGTLVAADGYRYNYLFSNLPVGQYVVRVSKGGLSSDPVQIAVNVTSGNESRNINFRLVPLKLYGAGLQLISTPLDYSNTDPRDVFSLPSGSPQYSAFRVAEWTGTDYVIFPGENPNLRFQVGKGYFVRFTGTATVQVQGGTRATFGQSFDIPLQATWNLIGNPFEPTVGNIDLNAQATVVNATGQSFSFGDAVNAGLIRRSVFAFTGSNAGSQYVQSTVLQPWLGYWIRANQAVTLRLTAPSRQTRMAANQTITVKQAETTRFRAIGGTGVSDWRLQIAARQGDLQDTDNSIGVAPAAKDGFDNAFDNEKPPMIRETPSLYVAMRGPGGEAGRGALPLTDDIRQADATPKTWEFTVQAGGSGDVTLFWPNVARVPRNVSPVLVDVATGRRVAMRSASSYRFSPGGAEARTFKIEVAPPASRALALVNVRTTRGRSGGYRFAFTATREADVQADIQTLTGKSVRRIQTRALAIEEGALNWDGRADNGAALPVGPYILNLTARDADGNVVRVQRPIQIIQ